MCFESKIVLTGNSQMVAYMKMAVENQTMVEGFITFVHVDSEAKPGPHGLFINPTQLEDIQLQDRSRNFMLDSARSIRK